MIHTELDAKRPIYYRGGNHAFVCDGIDADGLMHINWGWEGYCNGYFDINFLSIKFVGTGGGNGYYSNNQGMIIVFKPPKTDETDIDLQTTVLAEQASILCNKPQNITSIYISTLLTNTYTAISMDKLQLHLCKMANMAYHRRKQILLKPKQLHI